MLARSYISELTVFIIVKIPNLKDVSKFNLDMVSYIVNIPNLKAISKSIFEIVNKIVIMNNDNIKIIIAKKYLLISFILALILLRDNLLEYI